MSQFDAFMAFVVPAEAGFQILHGDPGNWTSGKIGIGALIGTNRGISASVLTDWLATQRGEPDYVATIADMKAVTADMQRAIFAVKYWNVVQGDSLPPGVGGKTGDAEVNTGSNGARCLQRAIGIIPVDGWIGPATLSAIDTFLPGLKIMHLSVAASKVIQGYLGVAVDGHIGPETQSALSALFPARARAAIICAAMYDQHIAYYRSLSAYGRFGMTWADRAMARLQAALVQTKVIP